MKARIRAIGIAVTALAAMGAAGFVMAAPSAAQAAQVISNIAYAPAQPAGSRGHLLDLYLPDGGGTSRPLIIWSSGSAWMSDNGKSGASSIAGIFNAKGYAVAGVSVRSSSQAVFPAQVYDIKAAIRWLRSKASQYQLDPNRFAIMGDSSGGWVADMATVTGGVASLEGNIGTTGVSSSVQAGVGFFGPTDFLQMNAQRPPGGLDHDGAGSPESLLIGCAIQTCKDKVAQANPIQYVDQNDPPLMLLHGQADSLVPHGQSVLLYNAYKSKCRDTQFISVPGAGHGTQDVMSTSRYGSQTVYTSRNCTETATVGSPNPSWDTIDVFLKRVLGIGTAPSPTPSSSSSPSPSPLPTGGACRVTYVPSTWNTGFTADVAITNTGATTVNGWALTWTWPGNQRVTGAWNATLTQSGTSVTARNVSNNGTIGPGARTNFGFQGTYSGSNTTPAQFRLNGTACTTG